MSAQQIDKEQIFNSAADLADAAQRAAYLDEACSDNPQLRAEIEELLRHDVDAGSFLEQPAVDFAPTIATGEFDTVDDSPGEVSLAFLQPSDKTGCIGTLAHYEVIELVGRGGMGLVLKAFDPKLNRVVAIKVMAPELAAIPMAVKRFLREAKAAAAVSHDHVVTIHAIHDAHNPPFIVMEFVDGQSLQEKIDHTGGLELKEILRIGMQMARGLEAAHEQGLVHRDIKPANILLENGVERVKITDFGLARAVDDVSVTQTGQIAGTPQFMSPEQAQGHALDARSDLFSLGSVLYTMCTGRPPFRADSAVAMLRRVTDDDPRSIREVNADIPDWLEAITFKLLAKDPTERFQSAEEVAELLSQHLAHLQHPTTTPRPMDIVPPVRHSRSESAELMAPKPRRKPASLRLWNAIAIAAGLLVAGCVLLGTIIHVVTDKGELVVQVDDPDVAIRISRDGREVKILKEGGYRFTILRSGYYNLEILGGDDSFEITHDGVLITRGVKKVVTVRRKALPESDLPVEQVTEVRTFKGHTQFVRQVAFSHDGRHAVSTSTDTTLRIWEIETGRELKVIDTGKPLDGLAVSPDDKLVAVGVDEDPYAVELWNIESGERVGTLEGHTARVVEAAFTPDGKRLMTSGYDWMVRIWDVESRQVVHQFATSQPAAAAMSPDGELVVTRKTDDRRIIRLWNTSGGAAGDFRTTEGLMLRSAFTSDSKRLAIVARGRVHLWDVPSGKELLQFNAHPSPVLDVRFTPDDRHLLTTGENDLTLRVWDAATGSMVAVAMANTWRFNNVAISPDGSYVIAGGGANWNPGEDRWDTDGDFDVHLYRLPESVWPKTSHGQAWGAVVRPETRQALEDLILAAREASTDEEWESVLRKHVPLLDLTGEANEGESEVFGEAEMAEIQKGGRKLIELLAGLPDAAHEDLLQAGYLKWRFSGLDEPRQGMMRDALSSVFAASSKMGFPTFLKDHVPEMLASGDVGYAIVKTPGGEALVWYVSMPDAPIPMLFPILGDRHDGEPRVFSKSVYKQLGELEDRPYSASPDSMQSASITEVRRLEGHIDIVGALAFTPDGKSLVSGSQDVLYHWDLATDRVVREIPVDSPVKGLVAHPDGLHVITSHEDGDITMWNLADGQAVREFTGHSDEVHEIAISTDGARLLSGGYDGLVRLWDIATGEPIRSLKENYCSAVALSHDGRLAAHGGYGTSLVVWDVDSGDTIQRMKRISGSVTAVTFSPDGRFVLAGDYYGMIEIWQVATGRQMGRLKVHAATIKSLHYTPDGRYFVSSSFDQTVQLFDTSIGRVIARAECDDHSTTFLAMAPDGQSLASSGGYWLELKDEATWEFAVHKDREFPIRRWRLPNRVIQSEAMTNSLGIKLRLIPAGEFEMGTADDDVDALPADDEWFFADFVSERRQAETPRHRVTISKPFEMSEHEVTIGQFRQFIDATGYKTTAEQEGEGYGWRNGEWQEDSAFNWRNPGFEQTDDHPVCNVSWDDAVAFCRWLSEKEGTTYRLPTEAEWEYACRGGTTTRFWTGDDVNSLSRVANLADQSLRKQQSSVTWAADWNDGFPATAAVGSFRPNAFGLQDMHGNVWEWCQDAYDEEWYEGSPAIDPVRRGSGRHVFRGGGFDNWPGFLRSADRYSSHSETIFTDWAGFRVVRDAR